jgi:hypothetical protein
VEWLLFQRLKYDFLALEQAVTIDELAHALIGPDFIRV